MHIGKLAIFLVPCMFVLHAQHNDAGPIMQMPQDRAAESYAIYSQLLPLGETEGWKAKFYAVQNATVAVVQPDKPCTAPVPKNALERARSGMSMNPHAVVTPAEGDRDDYDQIMSDFDTHCHDRLSLQSGEWTANLPVRLLTVEQQEQFVASRTNPRATHSAELQSPSLYAFSQVYFNAHHTVALVYATHWCGNLCAEGFWIALRKKDNRWKKLNWSASSWIS